VEQDTKEAHQVKDGPHRRSVCCTRRSAHTCNSHGRQPRGVILSSAPAGVCVFITAVPITSRPVIKHTQSGPVFAVAFAVGPTQPWWKRGAPGTSCACTAARHACAGLHKCARCRCFVNWPRWTAERPCCCSHAALQSCSKQGLGPPCAQGVEVLTDFVSCVQGALGHAAAVLRAAEAMENRPHFRTGVFSVFGYEKSGPGRGGATQGENTTQGVAGHAGVTTTYLLLRTTYYLHTHSKYNRPGGRGAQGHRNKEGKFSGKRETQKLHCYVYAYIDIPIAVSVEAWCRNTLGMGEKKYSTETYFKWCFLSVMWWCRRRKFTHSARKMPSSWARAALHWLNSIA